MLNKDEATKMIYEGAIMLMANSNPGSLEVAVDWAGDLLDKSLRRAEQLSQPQKATTLPFSVGVKLTLTRREAAWLKGYLQNAYCVEDAQDRVIRGSIFDCLVQAGAE